MNTDSLPLIEDERIGQYRTRINALKAYKSSAYPKLPHIITKTITWRNLEPYKCFTVVLLAPSKFTKNKN
jgi:hypothetical protein